MPKFRSFSVFFFLAVAAVLIGAILPVAHAQTLASSASFSGSVSDSSRARVANVKVTLSSPEKGITRAFRTDAEGNFSFALLPASTYTLAVEASGFKTSKQQGITLEVGQSASQAVILTIGSSEQIEVTAEAPLLQTDNANIGAEISSKEVTELPLNLPNVFNFVQLNSSVNNLAQQQTLPFDAGMRKELVQTLEDSVASLEIGVVHKALTAHLGGIRGGRVKPWIFS